MTTVIGKTTTIAVMTAGVTTTIDAITTIVGGMNITGEMTIAAATTIDRTIITVATMTMIGKMTIIVKITTITITTPTPTDDSQETTKGSPCSMSTGCKMCARTDGDHPTTTVEGHTTHGPTHHSHKSSTNDKWC